MKLPRFSLNLKRSLILSVLLHGGAFLLGFSFAAPEISPLPLGVELMYGDADASVRAKAEPVKAAPVKSVAVDDSEGPSIKNEKTPVAAAQETSTAKSLGTQTGTSDRGALQGREGVANGSEVSPEERYLYELKKLLEHRKRYPPMAKKMGQTGRVTLKFTLNADGSLQESEIVEKAPYESLNKAAHDLVKSISGLKPFPDEIQKTSWVITVPIEYSLN